MAFSKTTFIIVKWMKGNDGMPADKQEVLIRCGNSIGLAVYNARTKCFECRSGEIYSASQAIMWATLITTNERKG